jgi:hypothetical protein
VELLLGVEHSRCLSSMQYNITQCRRATHRASSQRVSCDALPTWILQMEDSTAARTMSRIDRDRSLSFHLTPEGLTRTCMDDLPVDHTWPNTGADPTQAKRCLKGCTLSLEEGNQQERSECRADYAVSTIQLLHVLHGDGIVRQQRIELITAQAMTRNEAWLRRCPSSARTSAYSWAVQMGAIS